MRRPEHHTQDSLSKNQPGNRQAFLYFIKNHRFRLLAVMLLGVVAIFWAVMIFHQRSEAQNVVSFDAPEVEVRPAELQPEVAGVAEEKVFTYKPVPISMDQMKKRGCVADGLLSGYGEDTDEAVAMIDRSNCLYLHRALETWGEPPDFEEARQIMEQIKRTDVVYGMFLAENLRFTADVYYPDEDRDFEFEEMCQEGSKDAWGPHTCRPDLGSKEYRGYLAYIMKQAIDLGIQNFLFGQIYYQDTADLDRSKVSQVLDDVRDYAKEKGVKIVIGAQTGTITDETYLRRFDYIEGGVGIGDDGKIENGPCWSNISSCWALLWNKRYASRANNVFVHLDWSGLKFDDMSSFARMDAEKRGEVLDDLHSYFTDKDIGFLMPMMATLHKENGGCRGPKKGFYSASNDYSCQDEDVINSILTKG